MTDSPVGIDLTPLVEDLMVVIEHLNNLAEGTNAEEAVNYKTDAEVVASALEFVQFLASLINGTLDGPGAAEG